jgi:hypothetical protein
MQYLSLEHMNLVRKRYMYARVESLTMWRNAPDLETIVLCIFDETSLLCAFVCLDLPVGRLGPPSVDHGMDVDSAAGI